MSNSTPLPSAGRRLGAADFELSDLDELIINRGPVPWWTIAADEARDYLIVVMEATNGEGFPLGHGAYKHLPSSSTGAKS